MRPTFLAALLASGCMVDHHTCVETLRAVSDDEPVLGGLAVRDLVELGAAVEVAATWGDGSATGLTVGLSRAPDDAAWIEADSVWTRRPGLPEPEPPGSPADGCHPHGLVPVVLELRSADGLLTLLEPVVARAPFDAGSPEPSLGLDHVVPFDDVEGLPPLDRVLRPEQRPPIPPAGVWLTGGWLGGAPPSGRLLLESDDPDLPWAAPLIEWQGRAGPGDEP